MKILLVEDNPGDIRLISESFKENPYPTSFEILSKGTLSEAISCLNQPDKSSIDVILLDLGLPDSLGIETLKKIQIHTGDIPVIVLTGMDDNDMGLQALRVGAQDYLIKNQITGHLLIKSILYAFERKNVEFLGNQKKITEEAARKKNEFLAMMVHEIRNPLGIIIGYSELLCEDKDKGDLIKTANMIQSNAEHLNTLISDILDLSRIEAGRIDLYVTAFDLKDEMNTLCDGLRIQAVSKGLTLTLDIDIAGDAMIKTDRTRFRQIILNLVGNAIKFTTKGGVSISIRNGYRENELEVIVKDTGCGMDNNDQENVFKPFSQGNKAVYAKYRGTGLGLSLSKELAKALDGDLRLVESVLGAGSTFLFTISKGLLDGVDEIAQGTKIPNEKSKLLDGVRIMVADDDAEMRSLEKDILSSVGATVVCIESGHKVLSEIKNWDPDIIFMDLHMPELNGYEVIKLIRNDGLTTPVIALTAMSLPEDRKKSLSTGFDDYLSKPFKINEFIEMAVKWRLKSLNLDDDSATDLKNRSALH